MNFTSLGLSDPLLKAVAEQGYETPSDIQAEAIPAVLNGRDVMAAAQTGTGKTAGFTLPILERLIDSKPASANQAKVLVLTPTRELAAQVGQSVETYAKYLNIKSAVVFGGVKINPQMMKLRKGVDVLVATPGRLLDLYGQNAIRFNHLEVFVLDEADRMLDMGFIHDIKRIISLLPKQRQNLMFSATFSNEIRALAKGLIHNPIEISVSPPNRTVKSVKQWIHPVDKKRKAAALTHLINERQWQQVLVFTRTKHGANRLAKHLEKENISALAIHGNKSQGARTRALKEFKQGKVQILVATDIAARGLDISQLPHVVNFDLPNVAEDYVHRIGRTGRAGATGEAISLVSADEFKQLTDIERLIQEHITRHYLETFEPIHELPDSHQNLKPLKPKKPKKPKKNKPHHSQSHGSDAGKQASRSNRAQHNKGPWKKKSKAKKSQSSQSKQDVHASGARSGNHSSKGGKQNAANRSTKSRASQNKSR